MIVIFFIFSWLFYLYIYCLLSGDKSCSRKKIDGNHFPFQVQKKKAQQEKLSMSLSHKKNFKKDLLLENTKKKIQLLTKSLRKVNIWMESQPVSGFNMTKMETKGYFESNLFVLVHYVEMEQQVLQLEKELALGMVVLLNGSQNRKNSLLGEQVNISQYKFAWKKSEKKE